MTKHRVVIALRTAAAVAALAVLAATSPAVAAGPPALTIRAGSTAETDLVLREAAVLDLAASRSSGAGRFGGWALVRQGTPGLPVAAELRVAAWDAGSAPVRISTSAADTARVPAGRYRLVVFADGPTTVTIPMRAGRAQRLTAARRTTARAQLVDLLATPAPAVGPDHRRTVAYGGTFVLSQTYLRSRAHQAGVQEHCFAPAAEQSRSCAGRQGGTYVFASPGSVGDGFTSSFAAAYGSQLPAGQDVDVLLRVVDVDAPTQAEWLVVTV